MIIFYSFMLLILGVIIGAMISFIFAAVPSRLRLAEKETICKLRTQNAPPYPPTPDKQVVDALKVLSLIVDEYQVKWKENTWEYKMEKEKTPTP